MFFNQFIYIPVLPDIVFTKVINQPNTTITLELIKTHFQNRLLNSRSLNFVCNPKIAVCKDKIAITTPAQQKIAAAG